MLDSVMAPGV